MAARPGPPGNALILYVICKHMVHHACIECIAKIEDQDAMHSCSHCSCCTCFSSSHQLWVGCSQACCQRQHRCVDGIHGGVVRNRGLNVAALGTCGSMQ